MHFVSSWDDGHPLDERVAELHADRGLKATFFVPLRNREGRSVMHPSTVRSLDRAGFEIGSHTADHCYLDRLPEDEAAKQIQAGKTGLEEILGHAVTGFCYPGGRQPAFSQRLLRAAGITYARTVENLRTDCQFRPLEVPTTFQFYPHNLATLVGNAFRSPAQITKKLFLVRRLKQRGSGLPALIDFVESRCGSDAYIHIWGHSWEIEKLDAWDELAKLLDAAKSCRSSITVGELVAQKSE